jgi:hypothetical protein
MNALALLKGLVALVSSIAEYMRDKRLIELGAAESVLKGLQDADKAIKLANDARANANSVPISTDQDDRANK